MAPNLDDDPPPKKPPVYCPWCGEPVVRRWAPHKIWTLLQHLGAKVQYVCLTCKVGVRTFKLPSQRLYDTKRAAYAAARRVYEDLEASGFRFASDRDLYKAGKCSCRKAYPNLQPGPCAVHRPLPRKAKR